MLTCVGKALLVVETLEQPYISTVNLPLVFNREKIIIVIECCLLLLVNLNMDDRMFQTTNFPDV